MTPAAIAERIRRVTEEIKRGSANAADTVAELEWLAEQVATLGGDNGQSARP